MAYVDKLVDTQDAVIHDFKGDDHDDTEAGRASDLKRSMRLTHPDLPPFLKVTSTVHWTTNVNSTTTPSTP
jgi:hypothetical protein